MKDRNYRNHNTRQHAYMMPFTAMVADLIGIPKTDHAIANWIGCSTRTVRHWRSVDRAPKWALAALYFHTHAARREHWERLDMALHCEIGLSCARRDALERVEGELDALQGRLRLLQAANEPMYRPAVVTFSVVNTPGRVAQC